MRLSLLTALCFMVTGCMSGMKPPPPALQEIVYNNPAGPYGDNYYVAPQPSYNYYFAAPGYIRRSASH